ncbi:hypothetical protein [Lonsdalea iberica]|uniref:hypothetical protein n=1 Tax=Lonsdalea iberica TaxID=1082703 RepID=UPI000B8C7CD1|nr:hypothetical protein [Lonsdalea iberica]
MSLYVGDGWLSAGITHQRVQEIHRQDTPPVMTLWEQIKAFFCSTHQAEALDDLFKLCHPQPEVTRNEIENVFHRLKELAAPGCKSYFHIENDEVNQNTTYRITDSSGANLLSVFYGTVTVKGANGTYDVTMCLPRTITS